MHGCRGHVWGFLLLLPAMGLLAPPTAAQPAGVSVHLELNQEFFYSGEPLPVRVTVRNESEQAVDNPVGKSLFSRFQVKQVDGGAVQAASKPGVDEPARPAKLASQSFYGAVVDLVRLFPALQKPGTYEIHWAASGMLSEQLRVRVIPRFDPDKEYRAQVVTDIGSFELSLFGEQSPVAVKTFVDLANSGYYDGLRIDEVHGDAYVAAGDPAGSSKKPFYFPAEQSAIPLVVGTVILRPAGATPPANGSAFAVLLKPQASWMGQVTALGQIVRGLDVVERISRVPSNGRETKPFFKPLKEIKIHRIQIIESTEAQSKAG